jgi:hypothetical protein
MSEYEPRPTIAGVNDAFRRSGRNVLCSAEIAQQSDLADILQAVHAFDDFTLDNDPYGEHDFGRIDWHDDIVLWKIDYYDQSLQCWGDPLSPECERVMTVMFGREY